jgi:hypothetical protein
MSSHSKSMEEGVNQQNQRDLQNSVTTLVANVANLKESQDKFHLEMKESFKDLRDNYSGQINNQNIRIDNIKVQIGKLCDWKNWLIGAYTIGSAIVVFMGIALFNHLINYGK